MNPAVWAAILVVLALAVLVPVFAVVWILTREQNAPDRRYKAIGAEIRRAPTPEERGALGEHYVSACLNALAGPGGQVIDGIILFNPETGKSSQIDHILLCRSGVYVVETKCHGGRIYGTDAMAEWREYFPNGEETSFYSPVKQNNSHLYIVRKIVGKEVPLMGIVVFATGDIRKVTSGCVTDLAGLAALLTARTDELLTPAQISEAAEKLRRNQSTYRVTAAEHLENIRKTQRDFEKNLCPRCGAPLVLRRTKQAPIREFYGCSNYPQCKFTKDV